jgi:radical SAM protein (TIGR01212 family)
MMHTLSAPGRLISEAKCRRTIFRFFNFKPQGMKFGPVVDKHGHPYKKQVFMETLPFNPISAHYKKLFNSKVYKIPVAIVETCPNREGLKGMETCLFCDVWGSAAREEAFDLPLAEQISKYRDHIRRKFKAEEFLIYFQAYTNTFTKLQNLRQHFDLALSSEGVRGFIVGTRPDCLSAAVLDLWNEYHLKSFVGVELGVQSFFDDHLLFMKRGHDRNQSLKALDQISKKTAVDLGIHLMFGWPGETDEHAIETARICNDLPISNIKLHNVHVLKNTGLEKLFARGEFHPLERAEYARRVQVFLEHLSPRLHIHRLAAYAPRWEELIAPAWTANKMGTHQFLIDWLNTRGSFQGKLFDSSASKSF